MTICGSGLYFGPVETELNTTFATWSEEKKLELANLNEEEQTDYFREFLQATYKLDGDTNIPDILSTMILAGSETSDLRRLIRHELACSQSGDTQQNTREKRATTSTGSNG